MVFTEHARKRQEQRSISDPIVDIILNNGRLSHAQNGAMKIFLGKKETNDIISNLKKAIQLIERSKGGSIIFDNEKILTVYKSS